MKLIAATFLFFILFSNSSTAQKRSFSSYPKSKSFSRHSRVFVKILR